MTQGKKDPYVVLGVSRNDSDADIKMAYRRLRKKYHPDYNPNPDAPERFRAVHDAYETIEAMSTGKKAGYNASANSAYWEQAAQNEQAKRPSQKERVEQAELKEAIRALNEAWSAFANRTLGLQTSLIVNALHTYMNSDRGKFLKHCASGPIDHVLKNIFQSSASKQNRARAEHINIVDRETHRQARKILSEYTDHNNFLNGDLSNRYMELQGEAGQCVKKQNPAPAFLLSNMEGLTRTLQYHNHRIDTTLDMIRYPKKNDNQTYTL